MKRLALCLCLAFSAAYADVPQAVRDQQIKPAAVPPCPAKPICEDPKTGARFGFGPQPAQEPVKPKPGDAPTTTVPSPTVEGVK